MLIDYNWGVFGPDLSQTATTVIQGIHGCNEMVAKGRSQPTSSGNMSTISRPIWINYALLGRARNHLWLIIFPPSFVFLLFIINYLPHLSQTPAPFSNRQRFRRHFWTDVRKLRFPWKTCISPSRFVSSWNQPLEMKEGEKEIIYKENKYYPDSHVIEIGSEITDIPL